MSLCISMRCRKSRSKDLKRNVWLMPQPTFAAIGAIFAKVEPDKRDKKTLNFSKFYWRCDRIDSVSAFRNLFTIYEIVRIRNDHKKRLHPDQITSILSSFFDAWNTVGFWLPKVQAPVLLYILKWMNHTIKYWFSVSHSIASCSNLAIALWTLNY